jgi:cytochrome c oxidase subunit 4
MGSRLAGRRGYYTVYAVLMACTYLTVQMAFLDLGPFNAIGALTIAAVKASLVAVFFMHVRKNTDLPWLAAIASAFWLGLLIALTMSDYLTRSLP